VGTDAQEAEDGRVRQADQLAGVHSVLPALPCFLVLGEGVDNGMSRRLTSGMVTRRDPGGCELGVMDVLPERPPLRAGDGSGAERRVDDLLDGCPRAMRGLREQEIPVKLFRTRRPAQAEGCGYAGATPSHRARGRK
jgi:hypothetical protein